MRVLAEITQANRDGVSADDIHELFRHAAELLDIVDEEIDNEPPEAQAALRSALTTMRTKLADLDRSVRPPRH